MPAREKGFLMQGSGYRGARLACAACAAALVLCGCGGGNRLFTNREGLVESGTLELDSIPLAPEEDEYVIGHGDELEIVFTFNREFNRNEISVRPDGRITIPLVGDITAAGMTPSMLDSVITSRYAEFLRDPDVSVIVRRFARQVVYVLGEVLTPGGYPYERGMTLLSALALGRGPMPRSGSNGVLIIRKIGPAHVVGIQIDYGDVADGKRFDLNVPLQAGDIVLVPKSRVGKAQDFTSILYDILSKPMDLYLKGWQVSNAKVMYDYYRRIGNF
jgi:polysaccharide export outer membrane protein